MEYRDRKGRYLTLEEYAELAGDLNYKVVARSYDFPSNGWLVSTVWLGVAFNGALFETCIFWPNGSEVMDRYGTEQEALEGHLEWVLRLNERLPLLQALEEK